jgi:hydroxypyruvate reductase
VAAVDSKHLVEQTVTLDDQTLVIEDQRFTLADTDRIVVIGAGKAGAGMAAGLESVLYDRGDFSGQVEGWVNVPADCTQPLRSIHLHPARPAGLNEPTKDGVIGSQQILALVSSLEPTDLCICLLSGGGSALLPAPLAGISLTDKQLVTQFLSGAGANIQQLNTVRKQLSDIKGGRLAEACQADRLITLIISDVPGDPLDIIASGPTVPDSSCAEDAIEILDTFGAQQTESLGPIYHALESRLKHQPRTKRSASPDVSNFIIGNNNLAVQAALQEAQQRGYRCESESALKLEGRAEEIGQQLSRKGLQMRATANIDCWISGGEPTVELVPASLRGHGGRNQQLVLAAFIDQFQAPRGPDQPPPWHEMALLSGGTDGEDGPTDAAGAYLDERVVELVRQEGLDPQDYLDRNDAYSFFTAVEALIKTGPTHTNVCDLRILLVVPQ